MGGPFQDILSHGQLVPSSVHAHSAPQKNNSLISRTGKGSDGVMFQAGQPLCAERSWLMSGRWTEAVCNDVLQGQGSEAVH